MKLQKMILAIGLTAFTTGCSDNGDGWDGRNNDTLQESSSVRSTQSTNSNVDHAPSGSTSNRNGSSTANPPKNNPPLMSGTPGSATQTGPRGGAGTGSTGVSDLDRVFVNDASSGGMFEVQSAQLALNQLENDQLKKAAQMIINDHTRANADLEDIAQRKGLPVAIALLPKHQGMLSSLRDSRDNEFDAQFRRTQVQAHEEAIAMFEQYVKNGMDTELQAFAQKCLPKLRMHLEELSDESGVAG